MNILPAEIDNPIIKSATMQVKSSIEAVLMDTLKRITVEGDSTGLAVMKLEDNFSNSNLIFSLNFEKYSSYYDLLDSNYKKDFEEIARVGKGAYGSVYKVKKYSDNNIYAVKVIKLKGSKEDLEVYVIFMFRVENFMSNVQLYIQMEFCPSTLEKWLDVRNEKESFKDEDNRTIMEQILRGIQHLHSMNVIHRDLKPLNILMDCDKLQIKITDFGLSRELYLKLSCDGNTKEIVEKEEVLLTSHVGTQPYIAPEIQGSSYDFKADLYSVGLIAYEIFCPMQSKSEKYKKFDQLKSHSEIDQKFQQEHPSEADLVIQLTQKDPNNRLTAFEALNHKLFQSKNQGMSNHSFELVKHEIEVLKEEINCIRNEVSQHKKEVDSFFRRIF
ncbi:hypothetical protein HELRODRAFT_162604 [Helobdella robusta]|uniref:Protein kinase domain-containing protein n=1 Tax=Helobdella robusta TaxID=6412 RepID=T1ESX1_HELRO|nr:hypothetical protein HELRODRAFT_162604 [Helobdella robusta]ESN99113.1 hypothetical protein HELRODRAFT_162604 [Helobdella robusta]